MYGTVSTSASSGGNLSFNHINASFHCTHYIEEDGCKFRKTKKTAVKIKSKTRPVNVRRFYIIEKVRVKMEALEADMLQQQRSARSVSERFLSIEVIKTADEQRIFLVRYWWTGLCNDDG